MKLLPRKDILVLIDNFVVKNGNNYSGIPWQKMKPFCMINPAKKYYLCVRKSVLDIHERKR